MNLRQRFRQAVNPTGCIARLKHNRTLQTGHQYGWHAAFPARLVASHKTRRRQAADPCGLTEAFRFVASQIRLILQPFRIVEQAHDDIDFSVVSRERSVT